ncbi:WSC domain-containing protein [Infundibulicybe gibba]|nr:WSC domain-containing protein [Infundibulicybe gibba]
MKFASTLTLSAIFFGSLSSVAHAATELDNAAPSAGFSYFGCVAEGTTGSRRALTGPSFTQSNMTPPVCQAHCSSYRYGGVENGNECYCGNSLTNNGASGELISEADCQTSCSGDSSKKCGGPWTLSVYTKPAPLPPAPTCGDNSKAVPFLRGYNPSLTDHFYTTSAPEFNHAVGALGYTNEGSVGHVWVAKQPGTIPLYRLYSSGAADHFYTTSASERDNAVANLGYTFESIIAYVYPRATCGAVPLYRLYSAGATDHFYTQSAAERDHAVSSLGYANEGVAGYVLG